MITEQKLFSLSAFLTVWDVIGLGGVVDEMGSLDSIIKLSSDDLENNGLFVMIGELGGMASFAVFLVHIYFLLDSTNGRLP